ncbi:hypothetical protein [Corynebacterium sp. TAE3-ERU12]|uniref:hypothetical protein n=1 Tax=Corynebacterium sp. TAE3-ERU12 TaxID=2849491 RepID=UPI00351D5FAA
MASVALACGLVACGDSQEGVGIKSAEPPADPTVVETEIDAADSLVDNADTVVVSAMGPKTERRAAAIAVAVGAPMLVVRTADNQKRIDNARAEGGSLAFQDDVEQARQQAAEESYWAQATSGSPADEVSAELERLKPSHVVLVGETDFDASAEGRTVITDAGNAQAFANITGREVKGVPEGERYPAKAIAAMDRKEPTAPDLEVSATDTKEVELPEMKGSGDDDMVILAAPGSPLGAIATARAAGHDVLYLPAADPRATDDSISAIRDGREVVGLGSVFGDNEKLAKLSKIAGNKDVAKLNLAGGGQVLFPGRRMVALYGHPGAPAMGVMGEETPKEAIEDVKKRVVEYAKYTDEPVVPMFEIIASVAQADPGSDGTYSVTAPAKDLEPYIDAITDAGGYVVLDLQPGNAKFLDQAKFYEDLLKRPNVGLALDAEWKMEPGVAPATEVGHVTADEVNEVADWLANLTRENNLPQKMLMLHQFQLQMIRDREKIDTSHPELSIVLHADGHGTPGQKLETWNVMKQDLQPDIFLAWKNFIDEDQPMFTPEQTAQIDPTPWVVTYQ